jgi:hypothetical protein
MTRRLLHVLRRTDSPPPPAELVQAEDSVVVFDEVPSHVLLELIFAHDTVVVW